MDAVSMSPEERRNSGLLVLLLFAQAYYKMLEVVLTTASWVTAVDMELNHVYSSIVANTKNLLKNHEDLADFPGTFEPMFPDLFPTTVADCEWDGMIAPHAEEFLSLVQRYVISKGVYEPDEGSAGWVFVELFRADAKTAVERATAYETRMRREIKRLLPASPAKIQRWDETWHRLLEWTNGSAPSERLAAQVLLSEGYRDLDPSHPLGGPDGARDATCTKDGDAWVMAVYFPRGREAFAVIRKKFMSDFSGVAANGADGFAFVTNQELALGERELLRQSVAPVPVELYHLERITAILDKPSMASVRKQFLQIE
ncbi:MAG: hypothetical protein Q8Q09_23850 [Deltaproteobacteria bacterium]|nr:hypothetical protein [Deltaproteobacteria bacterium]